MRNLWQCRSILRDGQKVRRRIIVLCRVLFAAQPCSLAEQDLTNVLDASVLWWYIAVRNGEANDTVTSNVDALAAWDVDVQTRELGLGDKGCYISFR